MLAVLKFLISSLFNILPLVIVTISFALSLIYKKRHRSGISIGLIAILVLYLCSLFPVAGLLLQPLQTTHKRYQPSFESVRYVVVLGGWHKTNKLIPLSSQFSHDSLVRIVEAIIIYRQNPGSKLLLSGAPPKNENTSNAQKMADMAILLGVPNKDIILEEHPKNTAEEALFIKEKVRGEPFVLVTSASHMLRATQLLHKQNLSPVPAPVNFSILEEIPFSLIPSTIALQSSEKSLHEYLGMLWAWLRQQI